MHRLRLTDRIFFVNVNLRPRIRRFNEAEYALLIDVLEASRRRLGFLLCGYVLMPDHWHALIWTQYPLLLEQVLHDARKIMMLRLHARRGSGAATVAFMAAPMGAVWTRACLRSLAKRRKLLRRLETVSQRLWRHVSEGVRISTGIGSG